mmetsp:Transcript_80330/g.236324  ORF Transcript_80330/g.236324 Transcript_80330/m.236324 type:complete len:358 (+) Transcript_80330:36-1109(+)
MPLSLTCRWPRERRPPPAVASLCVLAANGQRGVDEVLEEAGLGRPVDHLDGEAPLGHHPLVEAEVRHVPRGRPPATPQLQPRFLRLQQAGRHAQGDRGRALEAVRHAAGARPGDAVDPPGLLLLLGLADQDHRQEALLPEPLVRAEARRRDLLQLDVPLVGPLAPLLQELGLVCRSLVGEESPVLEEEGVPPRLRGIEESARAPYVVCVRHARRHRPHPAVWIFHWFVLVLVLLTGTARPHAAQEEGTPACLHVSVHLVLVPRQPCRNHAAAEHLTNRVRVLVQSPRGKAERLTDILHHIPSPEVSESGEHAHAAGDTDTLCQRLRMDLLSEGLVEEHVARIDEVVGARLHTGLSQY